MQITRRGEVHEVVGSQPEVGQKVPDFQLADSQDKSWQLKDLLDKPLIISVVPDIDTRVCAIQTRQFTKAAGEHPTLNFVTISNNTKEEQANWCAAEGLALTILHDDNSVFGNVYGLFVPDSGRLVRSIFVVDTTGVLRYRELVVEQTQEPDYQAALQAAEELL
ncbi:thiol peroxidase [Enterococcus sp. LJL90]